MINYIIELRNYYELYYILGIQILLKLHVMIK